MRKVSYQILTGPLEIPLMNLILYYISLAPFVILN